MNDFTLKRSVTHLSSGPEAGPSCLEESDSRLGGTCPAPSSPMSQEARLQVGACLHQPVACVVTVLRTLDAGGCGERARQEEAAVFPALEKNREIFHI